MQPLADAGFTALAPDLFDGVVATDDDHGRALLNEADPNQLAMGVKSCADALRRMPATPDGPIMIVGFSMGASLGLWLSEREPDGVTAVAAYYGTQGIDFTETTARYQFHMAIDDPMIDPDELALMEASLGLADRPVEIHTLSTASATSSPNPAPRLRRDRRRPGVGPDHGVPDPPMSDRGGPAPSGSVGISSTSGGTIASPTWRLRSRSTPS